MWAELGIVRRGGGGQTTTAATTAASTTAAATAKAVTDIWLFGDGTADHPNAGILFGNGYSWIGYAGVCPVARAPAVTARA